MDLAHRGPSQGVPLANCLSEQVADADCLLKMLTPEKKQEHKAVILLSNLCQSLWAFFSLACKRNYTVHIRRVVRLENLL